MKPDSRKSRYRRGPTPTRSLRDRLPSFDIPLAALAGVVALGLVVLGGATIAHLRERDWAAEARVNGAEINRAAVRGREQVLEFITIEQLDYIDDLRRNELIDEHEASLLTTALEQRFAETRILAIEGLIDGRLVHAELTRRQSAVPAIDAGQEVADARQSPAHRRLSWIRLAWQPGQDPDRGDAIPSPGDTPTHQILDAAANRLSDMLEGGIDRAAAIAQYEAAGWLVSAGHRWLPSEGEVSRLDAEVVADARAAAPGPIAVVTGIGWAVVAEVTAERPAGLSGQALLERARLAGVSDSALTDWAREQAEARTLFQALLAEWAATPVESVHAAEAVIGPADQQGAAGPWIQLAHLVVADLPESQVPSGDGSAAERLAEALRELPVPVRRARFWELVAEARAVAPRSGELGFFVREQLAPSLAERVFADGVQSGDIIGPIATDLGQELFRVQARYQGPLDERSIGALVDVRAGATGLFEMASSLSPGDAAKALGGPWRVAPEFERESAAYRALFETPVGQLTDPFLLDGDLVVAEILERKVSSPDANALARLSVHGLEIWLADRRAAATIEYVEAAADQTTPSPPSNGDLPTPLPASTPRLPVTPGAP